MKQLLLNFSLVLLCMAAISVNQAGATTCAQATVIPSLPYSQPVVCTGANDMTWANITQCDVQGTTSDEFYYGGQEAVLVYTASSTQTMNVSILGQTWTSISVYIGCPTSGGTCVGAIASTTGSKTLPAVQFIAGNTYYIIVDTWPAPASPCTGTGTVITIAPPPPPPANDECANAIELIPNPSCINVSGTNVNGSQSIPAITCAAFTSTSAIDVWYKFTATGATHTVTAGGVAALDLIIDVRSGACNGTNIACADAFASTTTPEVVNLTGLTVGTQYFVRVYGWAGANGAFNICLQGTAPVLQPPANDACANAIAITCGSSTVGNTTAATTDSAPTCITSNTAPGVWYTIQGTGDVFTLNTCGSSYDSKISVFTGACGSLVCVTGNDDFCSTQSQVEFLSVPGTTYRVLVHGFNTATGTFTLNASCAPPCPAPIAAPWTVTAIGGAVGAAVENCDGTYNVSTTGVGTTTADKIYFVHQTLSGNGYVIADINTFTSFTFGGVQFRDGLTAGARKVGLQTQLGARVARELRTVASGAHTVSQLAAPKHNYVRIARVGDVFTSSVSSNGVTWTQVNSVTVAGLPASLNVGFYVNSQLATTGSIEFGSAGVFSGAALNSDIASRNGEGSAYSAISAFPNPASSELNINMAHLTGEKVQVTVMNTIGQVVLQQNFDAVNEVERLDINKLNTGVYFLQVNTEAVQKVIVNK